MRQRTLTECLKLVSPDCGKKIYIFEALILTVIQVSAVIFLVIKKKEVSEIQLTVLSSYAVAIIEICVAYASTGSFAFTKSATVLLRTSPDAEIILKSAYTADEIRRLITCFFISTLNFIVTVVFNSSVSVARAAFASIFSAFAVYFSVCLYVYVARKWEKTISIMIMLISLPFVYIVMGNGLMTYILIYVSEKTVFFLCIISAVIAASGEKLTLRTSIKKTMSHYYGE